jgi:hypothetical protein
MRAVPTRVKTRFTPRSTIQAATRRARDKPLALAALAATALEAGLAAVGASVPPLSAAVLVCAPGLVLLPLLPERAARSPLASLAAVPALGMAASTVALISAASAGAPLEGWIVRTAIAAVVVGGLVGLPATEPRVRLDRVSLLPAAGLAGALAVGAALHAQVIGVTPVPGNDWAKYVLYADEIRRHGSLLIDNPYWMLGVPFREDPGVPALYGAFLGLSGLSAPVVMHGIGVFAGFQILSIFAFVHAVWGERAGVLAAALWAVLPLNHTLLGWHGLANAAAFVLFPVVLLYLTTLLTDGLSRRAAVGMGLMMLALAATHRLSFMIALGVVGAAIVVALAARAQRPRILFAGAAWACLAALALSAGVLYDIVERNQGYGGTQGYKAYLASKIDLYPLLRDLTIPFAVIAAGAVVAAVRRARREPSLVVPLCTLAVVVVLAYSWLAHVPMHYTRMVYFLPLALVPLTARWLGGLTPSRFVAGAAVVLVAAMAILAWGQTNEVQRLYRFANPASLKGLDMVAATLRPREVVATDRCWSFLATWLLHTRTLPALDTVDIQPKAEAPVARRAQAVLRGSPGGEALARRLGIRYLLADPTCRDAEGRALRPPAAARPWFVSRRLVVFRRRGR